MNKAQVSKKKIEVSNQVLGKIFRSVENRVIMSSSGVLKLSSLMLIAYIVVISEFQVAKAAVTW